MWQRIQSLATLRFIYESFQPVVAQKEALSQNTTEAAQITPFQAPLLQCRHAVLEGAADV